MYRSINGSTEIQTEILRDGKDLYFNVRIKETNQLGSSLLLQFTQEGWHNLISAAEATFLLDSITARQESP